jgi:UDP-N-acetylmuramoyl-tripeptide--D-alanyl-D-alanine ligase
LRLTLGRISEFISASGEFPHEAHVDGYSIDSRTVKPGELFFAVKGERLDGHDFVGQALANGAAAAVVARSHRERLSEYKSQLLYVDDTLAGLQTLGAAVRRLWNRPVIGVTGSAGKTTTKDAIAHVLSRKHRVLKSQGNLNNHFGLPLQLLKLEPQNEMAVIEMGMNHAGEISALAKIARPDAGVVTVVAPVHLEFFNSICEIARAKFELIQSLPPGGLAVLNVDDEYVCQFGRDFHGTVVTYSLLHPADVRGENLKSLGSEGTSFDLVIDSAREKVHLPLIGEHNVRNALAAAACGLHYHLAPSEIAAALSELRPSEKRGEILSFHGATVINDCYNSNPTALKSMVQSLASMPAKRRIVVAGEMLELGPAGLQLHSEIGEFIAGKADRLVGVRGLSLYIVEAAKAKGLKADFVETPEEAGELVARELAAGDVVLFKASRGVKLERALDRLREKFGQ